jgi:hypothetical protein
MSILGRAECNISMFGGGKCKLLFWKEEKAHAFLVLSVEDNTILTFLKESAISAMHCR